MMAGVDMVHVPYRGEGLALPDLISGQVQVLFGSMPASHWIHQGRQAARAGSDHRKASGAFAGRPDRGRISTRLRGERMVRGRRTQSHADGDCQEAQQGDQCRSCRSQHEETPYRPGMPRCSRVPPPTLESSLPTKPRSGPRWFGRQHQGGVADPRRSTFRNTRSAKSRGPIRTVMSELALSAVPTAPTNVRSQGQSRRAAEILDRRLTQLGHRSAGQRDGGLQIRPIPPD